MLYICYENFHFIFAIKFLCFTFAIKVFILYLLLKLCFTFAIKICLSGKITIKLNFDKTLKQATKTLKAETLKSFFFYPNNE